jgi:hypothetical protein
MSKVSIFALAILGSGLLSGCTKTEAYSPDKLNSQYGINGAYYDTFATDGGNVRSTVVPVTLADGRTAQLIIPASSQRSDPHTVYLRDNDGYHPVQLQDNMTRAQLVQSPQVVSRRVEVAPVHKKRSWEKDAMIIGGGAGGGALIGALAGGKKGAAVGAASGGVGGLIYDLATRKH